MADRYDPKTSLTLARCCALAYALYRDGRFTPPPGYTVVDRFKASFTLFNVLLSLIRWRWLRWPLLPVIWFTNHLPWNREYFGFALKSSKGDHYILAFRGTQDAHDWFTDLDAIQVKLSGRLAAKDPAFEHAGVHQGFQLLALSLEREVYQAAKDFGPEARVYVTGHSLGGAVAVLMALMLKTRLKRDDVQLYSYAAPRVGDPVFKRAYDPLIPCFRVVNLADVVPLAPPLELGDWKYADLGKEWAFLNQSGDIVGNHGIDADDNYLAACEKKIPSAHKRRYPMKV